MLFNSLHFLVFFPIVVLAYMIIPSRWRGTWLLAASYYFYMSWNPKYALLIALSTIITFLSGILLEKPSLEHKKRYVVALSFVINIGILFWFKYFDFFLGNINTILSQFHLKIIEKPFDVILPVGISFYTFQALSYTVDVYRGDIQAEHNLFRYALFVSFFPQLVAGPIERSKRLLKQIQDLPDKKLWNYDRIVSGFTLMLWGMFQKMVIADRVAVMVNRIFDEYFMYQSTALICAAIAFALQIYCDFASYSTIATGAAKVMDFELMENFNTPYFSESISEFWRRWHISLSSWLRDYLYIPLGGNRCSKWRNYFNIMVTFLISGLWHGASWNYVVWGGIHGLYQIIGKELRPAREKMIKLLHIQTENFGFHLGRMLITFLLTDFAWIFFRAGSMKKAFYYMIRMFTKHDWWSLFDGSFFSWGFDRQDAHVLLFAVLLLCFFDMIRYQKGERMDTCLLRQSLWIRWVILFLLIFGCIIWGVYGIDVSQIQFIYFQF